MNNFSNDQVARPHRARVSSSVASVDRWDGADPFDLRSPRGDVGSPRTQRAGTALFWAAVSALIIARIILFDPAATRPVGSFPGAIAPAASIAH